jgi:glycosyltransferase involved in cell wall biosynthesis
MQPAVSVILPTFNRQQYLPPTMASMFAQTFQNWELLIADDGSGPETQRYLRTLEGPPRRRVRHRPTA